MKTINENNEGPQEWIDPALEARVVAWVLGETSAFEAAELERILAGNPELAIFKRRIEAVHALAGAAIRPKMPKIQLSPDRRQKLLATIGVPPSRPVKKVKVLAFPAITWLSPHVLQRVAACLVIGGILALLSSLSLPAISGSLHKASRRSLTASEREPGGTFSAAGGSDLNFSFRSDTGQVVVQDGQTMSESSFQPDAPVAAAKPMVAAMNVASAYSDRDLSESVPPPPASLPPMSVPSAAMLTNGGTLVTGIPSTPMASSVAQPVLMAEAAAQLSEHEALDSADAGTVRNRERSAGTGVRAGDVAMLEKAEALAEPLSESVQLMAATDELRALPQEAKAEASSNKALEDAEKQIPQQQANTQLLSAMQPAERALNKLAEEAKPLVMEAMKSESVAKAPATRLPAGTEEIRDGNGRLDGFIQYGAPINPTPDMAVAPSAVDQPVFRNGSGTVAGAELSADVAAAQGGERAGQATVIHNFTGGWAKGSGGGAGGGVARNKSSGWTENEEAAKQTADEAGGPSGAADQMEVTKAKESDFKDGADKNRVLNQSKGVDLMSELEVEAKSGQRAPVQVARELQDMVGGSGEKLNERSIILAGADTYTGSTTVTGGKLGVVRGTAVDLAKRVSEKKSDSTPVLGDVPIAGRFFRADAVKDRESRTETEIQSADASLREAQDYTASGRYDLAFKRYEQVLNADPYNADARRGMEQVNSARTKAQETAYNETRDDMARQVNRAWETPVRRFDAAASQIISQPQSDTGRSSSINRKLDEIIIPKVDFRDVTVRDALEFLKQRAATLDAGETDPARKGVNIVQKRPSNEDESKITLALTDIPLRAAIDYVARAANLKLKVEPYAVVIVPQIDATNESPVKVLPTAKAQHNFQTEIKTAKQPFSTFSLHVSDVSFQLAKDALAKGAIPDPDRIRAEEFYNAFDYNDPSPAPGEEVACRIEQCANPFVQQRDMVRIALKVAAAGRAAGQPLRLTILLDTSGSMEREDRAASVRRALKTLATLLGPNDRVTLIGFARTPRLLAEQVPGDQAGKLVEIAARTPSEGGTNLEQALALASEQALNQKLPGAQNRIVLLTDGAANLGNADPARLARQIEKTRQQGISFDACGVGANGLNDEMLEALTRKGDGRYYFLNRPEDADAGFARQLAGALRPAAENVKVQVVFNPARVGQYRLIGFEKHLLKKEDFRNDKVQAAELSAEEAGVAVYQVQTLPEGEGELGEVFVRFRDPATGLMVERSWTMPFDARASAYDNASPSMQLAATAALLAERLRGDTQVDLDAMAPVITNLRSKYPHQAKVADLIRMYERMRR